jgi:hypothetical protein
MHLLITITPIAELYPNICLGKVHYMCGPAPVSIGIGCQPQAAVFPALLGWRYWNGSRSRYDTVLAMIIDD